MKIETVNLNKERKLITLLIMNDSFCSSIVSILKPEVLVTPYAQTVADWAKEYYEKYNVAPKSNISDVYEEHVSTIRNTDLLENIKVFLGSLATDYHAEMYTNLPFYVDEAETYLRVLGLKAHCTRVVALAECGKLSQAEAEAGKFNQVAVAKNVGISIMEDTGKVVKLLTSANAEPLFTFQGALGEVVGAFHRQDFYAALSRMKGAKSWHILHLVEAAARAGCRVLHIDLEMREEEPTSRFVRGLLWKPLKEADIMMPTFVCDDAIPTAHSMWRIEQRAVHKQGIDLEENSLRSEIYQRMHGDYVRIVSLPSGSTTVKDIEALLDNLAKYKNYVPDVVTIDYCDLLGSKARDTRDKLNDIWLNLRRVAQERNICVGTVTQSTRSGTNGKELKQSDISEDIRKLAHVTHFTALYGTPEQEKNGYYCIKCLDTRYKRHVYEPAIITQCFDIGRGYVDSRLESKVIQ